MPKSGGECGGVGFLRLLGHTPTTSPVVVAADGGPVIAVLSLSSEGPDNQ